MPRIDVFGMPGVGKSHIIKSLKRDGSVSWLNKEELIFIAYCRFKGIKPNEMRKYIFYKLPHLVRYSLLRKSIDHAYTLASSEWDTYFNSLWGSGKWAKKQDSSLSLYIKRTKRLLWYI